MVYLSKREKEMTREEKIKLNIMKFLLIELYGVDFLKEPKSEHFDLTWESRKARTAENLMKIWDMTRYHDARWEDVSFPEKIVVHPGMPLFHEMMDKITKSRVRKVNEIIQGNNIRRALLDKATKMKDLMPDEKKEKAEPKKEKAEIKEERVGPREPKVEDFPVKESEGGGYTQGIDLEALEMEHVFEPTDDKDVAPENKKKGNKKQNVDKELEGYPEGEIDETVDLQGTVNEEKS